MSIGNREAFAHHVEKWQRREPEMALADVFCPPAQRERFRAWGALLFELREAVFELSDERVTAVKTGWWAETLLALEQGQRRHTLTEALSGTQAPWSALARAVIEVAQYDERPGQLSHSLASVQPLAQALVAVEAVLFEGEADAVAAEAVAVHLLLQRLPHGLATTDAARVPLHLLARHGLAVTELGTARSEPLLRDWAAELLAALPRRLPAACLYRRLRTRFDRVRLQRLAAGRGFSPAAGPLLVWQGWRAARAG